MTKDRPSPVAIRIRQIIDREEGGNVSSAARKLKLSQRGLQKIYVGETDHPGANILEALVNKYRLDAQWLLTGHHADNDNVIEGRARKRCAEILSSLATLIRGDNVEAVVQTIQVGESFESEQIRRAAQRIAECLVKTEESSA